MFHPQWVDGVFETTDQATINKSMIYIYIIYIYIYIILINTRIQEINLINLFHFATGKSIHTYSVDK